MPENQWQLPAAWKEPLAKEYSTLRVPRGTGQYSGGSSSVMLVVPLDLIRGAGLSFSLPFSSDGMPSVDHWR